MQLEKNKKSNKSVKNADVAAPIKGANQDQSGYSPLNNVSDYTISDSMDLTTKLHNDKQNLFSEKELKHIQNIIGDCNAHRNTRI